MKIGRQNKIIELVRENDIETQEELADLLQRAGYTVTQATVSRDIRELKLTKVQAEDGRQKYGVLEGMPIVMNEKSMRILRDAFVSVDYAQNILVVKTASGMAMAAAAALDSLKLPEIVGSIAGDDTVMCAIRSEQQAAELKERLSHLIYGK